jgi:hypothetical protein
MIQIVAVLPHKAADRLGLQWKAGRCNAYTRTLVRVCGSEEELQLVARTLPKGAIWGVEAAGA